MGRHVRRRGNRVRGTLALVVAVCALTTSRPVLHDTAAVARPVTQAPAQAVSGAVPAATDHGFGAAPARVAAGPLVIASAGESERGDRVRGGAARSVRVSSPKGTRTWTASAMSDHGIPAAAMRAYRNAAARLRTSDPTCGLPWTLLAGIGRVESDHGRYGGATLARDGTSHPRIIGMRLDGSGPVAAIRDTDRGRLDGDRVWDRAVGPMQFIPATWEGAGGDGDGDGTSSPHDLDDAALAAATYLCSGSGPVTGEAAMAAAVYRYNQDDYYVALVLAFERGYRTGVFALPSPPADEAPAQVRRGHHAKHDTRAERPHHRAQPDRGHARPDKPPHHRPAGKHGGESTGPAAPVSKPGHAPKKPPKASSKPPAGKPTKKPAAPPTEPPTPALTSLTGQLVPCEEPTGWCLGDTELDLGQPAMNGPASADFDGDGSTETLAEELDGLASQDATSLLVEEGGAGVAVVYVINGHDYRNADSTLA